MTCTYGLHHHASDLIRTSVRCWSPIFEVALPSCCALSRNSDASTTIRNAPAEAVNVGCFVLARHAVCISLAVDSNVLNVTLLKLAHHVFNGLEAIVLAHILGGDVGVETGSVPITWNGLWVEGHDNAKFFGDTMEQETSQPEMVAHYIIVGLVLL